MENSTVKFDYNTNHFLLQDKRTGRFEHYFCFDQILSRESLIDFLYHEMEKSRLAKETIYDFLKELDEVYKKKFNQTVRGKLDCYGKL